MTRRELLAVVDAVKKFHHYLYNTPTTVRTDHGALTWLRNFKNPEGQTARWLEILESYHITMQYRPGRKHGNADALSRRPCEDCHHCERQETKEIEAVRIDMLRAIGTGRGQKERHRLGADDPWLNEWDRDQLKDWQESDVAIGKAKKWTLAGEKPSFQDIKTDGTFVRTLWTLYSQLEMKDGLLYRRCKIEGQPEEHLRLVAPEPVRKFVMEQLHEHRMAGHMGQRKTSFNVRRRFWWPGVTADIEQWCQECRQCQFRNKRAGRKNHNLVQDPVG